MPERFWRWLHTYSLEKIQMHWMARQHHDRKCPNCETWISEMNGCKSLKDAPDGQEMVCVKCNHKSLWAIEGPLAFVIDPATLGKEG